VRLSHRTNKQWCHNADDIIIDFNDHVTANIAVPIAPAPFSVDLAN